MLLGPRHVLSMLSSLPSHPPFCDRTREAAQPLLLPQMELALLTTYPTILMDVQVESGEILPP